MAQDSLTNRIRRQLPPEQGPRITAAETEDAVILSGIVPTEEERAATGRAAAALAPGKRIENLLEVERMLPEDRVARWGDDVNSEPLYEDAGATQDYAAESPDTEFTGQPLKADAPEHTFYASTDPIFTPNQQGNITVLGGFSAGEMEDTTVDSSVEDNTPGDEALVDAVTRELREDALTTRLGIDVVVETGVVHLRGRVPALEDAENAEEVAGRVPGVREVIEELDVSQL